MTREEAIKELEFHLERQDLYDDIFLDACRLAIEALQERPKGRWTEVPDKNGKWICEDDIVQYQTTEGFDCQSIVKFGQYLQDGSDGEYKAKKCLGFYVEVENFTCPDWAENDPSYFPEYKCHESLLEVSDICVIIGNIHTNNVLI